MNLLEIGLLIKERRAVLSLKQEDLSELSAVSLKTINQIENGKGNPSIITIEKIFDVLGLEIKAVIKSI